MTFILIELGVVLLDKYGYLQIRSLIAVIGSKQPNVNEKSLQEP